MRDYMIGGIIGIALTYLMWVDLGFLAWFLFVLIFGGIYLYTKVGIERDSYGDRTLVWYDGAKGEDIDG